jgi:hypothetical protein
VTDPPISTSRPTRNPPDVVLSAPESGTSDPQLLRFELAKAELEARSKLAARGQLFAAGALVLILGAVVWLGLAGHDWLAGGIGGAYLVSVVGLFITGRYQELPKTDKKTDGATQD